MEKSLLLYICQSYFPEVNHILNSGDFPDIRLVGYPADCMSFPVALQSANIMTDSLLKKGEEIVLVGSSCTRTPVPEIKANRKIEIYQLDYCSEVIFSKELIEYYIQKRYYLITSGWLINYKSHIKNWGFDPEMAKKFFAESADRILLLDTGIDKDYQQKLDVLSDYMGLPCEILPVGLSHCRRLIESVIFKWRVKQERAILNEELSLISRKAADHAMVFEQMQVLVDLTDESEIVQEVFHLLNLLFAPGNISYQPFIENLSPPEVFFSETNADLKCSSDCFKIEARNRGEVLGVFTLFGLQFPEYLEQYKPMRKIIGGVGGLAIANARKYKRIEDSELRLKNLTLELQAANANKDKFFSIIAHDLRSPLSSFLSLAEYMADESDSMTMDEMKNMANVARNSAKTLFDQLENLLEWSRMQMAAISVDPVILDLWTAVNNEVEFLQNAALQKGVVLNNLVPKETWVYADKNMLHSVIRNLVNNAVKFSHPDGCVTISAQVKGGDEVEFSVGDTGIGMTPEMMNHLFQLHQQVNRRGTRGEASSGLGLILCKGFVEKLSGKIRVESEVGKGSTFFVSLPRVMDA